MTKDLIKFGIIADIQYARQPSIVKPEIRVPSKSLSKLKVAIKDLNKQKLTFTVQLGDIIDRDSSNLSTVLTELKNLKSPVFHVLGNHDFLDENHSRGATEIIEMLGLSEATKYYSKDCDNWRFIFLDSNELGVIETKRNTPERIAGQKYLEHMKDKVNAQDWNGGLSNKQMIWLEQKLKEADTLGLGCILFAHHPIAPDHRENMLNNDKVIGLLKKYKSPKAFINGHNHDGNYAKIGNFHCITIEGMLDFPNNNAYAYAELSKRELIIHGFSRASSYNLKLS